MPPSAQAIARYRRAVALYRTRTAALLVAAWDALDSYEEADADRYAELTAPALAGAKTAAVALSAGFFALGMGARPVGIRAADVAVEARIRHPFLSTWHALNEDRPFDDAVRVGRSQAEAVGFDFVQSTTRRTGDVVAAKSGMDVRWRRVPGGDACAWCYRVAGQLYRTAESADFGHDRDDCAVVPA